MTPPLTAVQRDLIETAVAESVTRNEWIGIHVLADAACRFLELHPADDGEELTDEYLDSLFPGREVGEETSWWINLEVWISWGNYGYSAMHTTNIIVLTIKTRGDLRRLLAGLQIPLPRPGGKGG